MNLAFDLDARAHAPIRLKMNDGVVYEVVRTSASSVTVTKLDHGTTKTLELTTAMTKQARAELVADAFDLRVTTDQNTGHLGIVAATNGSGMPVSSNGACSADLWVVAGDALILVLATADAALLAGGLDVFLAGILAAGAPITAEIMAAATAMASAYLIDLIGAIALGIHLADLVQAVAQGEEGDAAEIAAVSADLAARLGVLSAGFAAGFGAVVVFLDYLTMNLNDCLNAIRDCTGPGTTPPGNGNPGFTTVSCAQSGGYGASFDPSQAWVACRGVIGAWKTDYSRYGLNYWSCSDLWGDPDQAPDYNAICNGWVNQCVAATKTTCINAKPPAQPPVGPPLVPVQPVATPVQ